MEPHDGVFNSFELAHNHADDAAIWHGMMVPHPDAVLGFLEWKAGLLSFLLNADVSI